MQKTKRFGLVLNPLEKDIVTRLAELEGGLSQAALLRRLIRKAAYDRGLWPSEVTQNVEPPIVREGQNE